MTEKTILDALAQAIIVGAEAVPGVGPELHDGLAELMPPLLSWLDRKIDQGQNYKAPLYALFLAEADAAADAAEDVKFGPERPTKP